MTFVSKLWDGRVRVNSFYVARLAMHQGSIHDGLEEALREHAGRHGRVDQKEAALGVGEAAGIDVPPSQCLSSDRVLGLQKDIVSSIRLVSLYVTLWLR